MSQSTILTNLFAKERFSPDEQWISSNLLLETQMGSYAYGTNIDSSDIDFIGIVMDQHQCLYPTAYGLITGYDDIPKFSNVEYKGEMNRILLSNGKECEGAWHSLTDFFRLVKNGSPNLTEVLFAKRNLVRHGHKIGFMLRDNRKIFLSMKMFYSMKGYCFSQLKRLRNHVKEWNDKKTCDNSNRREYYEKCGYDCKMAYHCLRLIDLVDQLIKIGDLDLMRNREESKAMREGNWGTWEKFELYVGTRLSELEKYVNTNPVAVPLREPNEPLHELLMNCIEEYYGNVDNAQTEYITTKKVYEMFSALDSKLSMLFTKQ